MFDADRPITTRSQDRLNRSIFAKYLARCLIEHRDLDSTVIGLHGSHGCGKTSLINLIIEELNFAATNIEDIEKPIILNFNAWSYSGQNRLIYNFFEYFFTTLSLANFIENRKNITQLLELYLAFFNQSGHRLHHPTITDWKQVFTAPFDSNHYGQFSRDLTLIKSELNALFAQQKHRIVIFIDNISQLEPQEIKQIFQIVKSLGDYINTTYVLSLDRNSIMHTLNQHNQVDEEIFNTIVQLPFQIPEFDQIAIEKILFDRLNSIVETIPEEAWDVEHWNEIYHSMLRHCFRTTRDITHYVNTLKFGYPMVASMVNPVDYFVIIALEIFAPEIYAGIRENKDLFTDLLDHTYTAENDQTINDKLRCDEILNRSSNFTQDQVLGLIIKLFPRIHKLYFPAKRFYHSEIIAHKLKRICNPDYFPLYFHLSLITHQIPDQELNTILNLARDQQAFDHAIAKLNQDERIPALLAELENSAINKIPYENVQTIIYALLNNGDLFPQVVADKLSLPISVRIYKIIHNLLHKLPSPDERAAVLNAAFKSITKSLYIPCMVAHAFQSEHIPDTDTYIPEEIRDLLPQHLYDLQHIVINQIYNWANRGNLIDHPNLISILNTWREFGDPSGCTTFLIKITSNDIGLVTFLTDILAQPIQEAMTNYIKNPAWQLYLEQIEKFIPTNNLAFRARAIFEDDHFEKLREKEQLAIIIFLDLIKIPTNKIIKKTTV